VISDAVPVVLTNASARAVAPSEKCALRSQLEFHDRHWHIVRIVTCIDIIRIITAANDNAFHNCFARGVAILITTISLNTIAISLDTNATVNVTYTAAATAPTSRAFDRID